MPKPENLFLERLHPDDASALRPLLRRVTVHADQIVVDQGAPVEQVHFPIDSQFANLIRFDDGNAVETAVIGNEGMTGLAPFMADKGCAWEIVCRSAGDAWVASVGPLRALINERSSLMFRLLSLTDLYQAQAAQTAACNALHSAPQRIAKWILTADDLSPRDVLDFRQEELARLVGARRATVSEAASELKRRKIIGYQRGAIRILDRPGLEASSCVCYRMLRPRLEALSDQDKVAFGT